MRYFSLFLLTLLLSVLLFTPEAWAHGMSEEDKQHILDAGYVEYMLLGAKHMLTGYDHLLFLFGVIFFLTKFKDVLLFVTAFTIGHCITLIFATLLHIQANYYLIDAVIALTVIYKAFDNLEGFQKYLNMKSPNLVGMVFAFGLIHGFGLSTRLQQLPLGDEGTGLVLRILSFNLGVEAGQILALGAMLLLLSGWRKTASFAKFGKAANAGLMMTGALLLLMQLHGYQHTAYPDDYPMNKDDHYHVHSDMDAEKNRASLQDLYAAPKEPAQDVHTHGDGKPHSH